MFSKAKKNKDVLAEVQADTVPDVGPLGTSATTKPTPRAKPGRGPAGVPSLISADVVIRGAIESEGEVQFDGEIEGDIRAKALTIGEGARVVGEVVAEKVRVCGTVEGAIRATRVELAAGSLVRGDVMHTALAIEAGAKFEGNVRHSDDPIGEPRRPAPPDDAAPVSELVEQQASVQTIPADDSTQDYATAAPVGRGMVRRTKADLR